jgi:adenosylcobinamide amidohydrolase
LSRQQLYNDEYHVQAMGGEYSTDEIAFILQQYLDNDGVDCVDFLDLLYWWCDPDDNIPSVAPPEVAVDAKSKVPTSSSKLSHQAEQVCTYPVTTSIPGSLSQCLDLPGSPHAEELPSRRGSRSNRTESVYDSNAASGTPTTASSDYGSVLGSIASNLSKPKVKLTIYTQSHDKLKDSVALTVTEAFGHSTPDDSAQNTSTGSDSIPVHNRGGSEDLASSIRQPGVSFNELDNTEMVIPTVDGDDSFDSTEDERSPNYRAHSIHESMFDLTNYSPEPEKNDLYLQKQRQQYAKSMHESMFEIIPDVEESAELGAIPDSMVDAQSKCDGCTQDTVSTVVREYEHKGTLTLTNAVPDAVTSGSDLSPSNGGAAVSVLNSSQQQECSYEFSSVTIAAANGPGSVVCDIAYDSDDSTNDNTPTKNDTTQHHQRRSGSGHHQQRSKQLKKPFSHEVKHNHAYHLTGNEGFETADVDALVNTAAVSDFYQQDSPFCIRDEAVCEKSGFSAKEITTSNIDDNMPSTVMSAATTEILLADHVISQDSSVNYSGGSAQQEPTSSPNSQFLAAAVANQSVSGQGQNSDEDDYTSTYNQSENVGHHDYEFPLEPVQFELEDRQVYDNLEDPAAQEYEVDHGTSDDYEYPYDTAYQDDYDYQQSALNQSPGQPVYIPYDDVESIGTGRFTGSFYGNSYPDEDNNMDDEGQNSEEDPDESHLELDPDADTVDFTEGEPGLIDGSSFEEDDQSRYSTGQQSAGVSISRYVYPSPGQQIL